MTTKLNLLCLYCETSFKVKIIVCTTTDWSNLIIFRSKGNIIMLCVEYLEKGIVFWFKIILKYLYYFIYIFIVIFIKDT